MLCSLHFTVSHSMSLTSHLKSQFLREVFPLVPAPVPVFCSPGPCSILFVAFITMRSCAIYAFVSLALLEWERPPPSRCILRATAVPSAEWLPEDCYKSSVQQHLFFENHCFTLCSLSKVL